jgi:hypothetical protein
MRGDAQERGAAQRLADLEFRERGFARRMDPDPAGAKGSQGGFNAPGRFQDALHQDEIGFSYLPALKLQAKSAMRLGVFREKDHAARSAVKAMDDVDLFSGALLELGLQRLPGQLAAPRDHDLARRLGDREEALVFIKHKERRHPVFYHPHKCYFIKALA